MKRIIFLALLLFAAQGSLLAQSRTNRIYRPCPGTLSFAQVSVDPVNASDSITIQPCPDRIPLSTAPLPSVNINDGNGALLAAFTEASGISFGINGVPVAGFYVTSTTTQFAGDVLFGATATGTTPDFRFNRTITPIGTTGDQTINKIAGTINVAAAAASVTLTNSLISANSIILPVIRTKDATCTQLISVVPASGSAVFSMNAGCTAATSIGFVVTN